MNGLIRSYLDGQTRVGGWLPMRWDRLFEDIEAQAAECDRQDFDAEVIERIRIEVGATTLSDRLAGAANEVIRVDIAGLRLQGRMMSLGSDVVVLTSPARVMLVPLAAVCGIQGLPRLVRPASTSAGHARLGLRSMLRRLAQDRAEVEIRQGDRCRRGTIDAVGQDWFELAEHSAGEPRREAAVLARNVIPLASLSVVSVLAGSAEWM